MLTGSVHQIGSALTVSTGNNKTTSMIDLRNADYANIMIVTSDVTGAGVVTPSLQASVDGTNFFEIAGIAALSNITATGLFNVSLGKNGISTSSGAVQNRVLFPYVRIALTYVSGTSVTCSVYCFKQEFAE